MIRNKKAVDTLICRNGKKPALYFIEIKYHITKHGRLGTGHGKGGGIQPEILQLQPDYFKKQMRWILGSEMHEGYWMLDNKQLLEYITGKEIGRGIKKANDFFAPVPVLATPIMDEICRRKTFSSTNVTNCVQMC